MRIGEVAQRVKVPPFSPDDLILILGTHVVKGEDSQKLSSDPHIHDVTRAHTHTQINLI